MKAPAAVTTITASNAPAWQLSGLIASNRYTTGICPEHHFAVSWINSVPKSIKSLPISFANMSSNMPMKRNVKSLCTQTAPPISFAMESSIMLGVQTCYSYLRWSSLAEKSLLCLDRYWILALGTAPSAEAEMGHIGCWLPQLSFTLINEKIQSFQLGDVMKMFVQKQNKYFQLFNIYQMKKNTFNQKRPLFIPPLFCPFDQTSKSVPDVCI